MDPRMKIINEAESFLRKKLGFTARHNTKLLAT